MNKRLLSVLVFGVVIAGVASFILYKLIAARLVASASTPTVPVVVATRTLPIGTLIKDVDVKVVGWSGTPPHGASSRMEDVVGHGVISSIVEGEPVVQARLADKGGFTGIIPTGMRAVGVQVNEVVGVAGFVVPGTRVDILISGNPPGQATANVGTLTRTILQNIEVLSAGTNMQKDQEGKPIAAQVVNLLVTPEQAEILSLASQETRIRLVLRNPLDQDVAKTPGTAMANLFGGNVKPPPPARPAGTARRTPPPVVQPIVQVKLPKDPPLPFVVEVYSGRTKTESKFQPEPEAKQ